MPPKPDAPLRVALIEDEREVRDGLAALIQGTSGFACAASYRTMEEALQDISRVIPDLVLLDLGLPGMSGVEGIGVLRERYPELPLVALTVYDDNDRIFDALCAGASGYLLKNTPPARLLESLTDAAEGGAPMSPEIARRVVRLFRELRPERASCRLTAQETELLKLLVEGHHYKTAASAMNVSINTISFHLKNIYTKLQVHSKSEAVAKALRQRLV
jgi:DNA-binding NarL/FixJ family response regulator